MIQNTIKKSLPPAVKDVIAQLGKRIRIARKRRALSMEEMANRMFVTRKTLTRLEKGDPGVSCKTCLHEGQILYPQTCFQPLMMEAKAAAPQFEIIGNFFKVTLFPVNGGVNGGVNDLLAYIQANPGQKTDDIKKALAIPQRSLERSLKKLRNTNKIEFRGSTKTGGYFPLGKR